MNEPKSSRYHRLKRRAGLLSLVCTAGLLGILLWSGGSAVMRDVAVSVSRSGVIAVAIYVLALAALQEAVLLPLAFYRSFVLERRYELSSEPGGAWLRDHAKAFILSTGAAPPGR